MNVSLNRSAPGRQTPAWRAERPRRHVSPLGLLPLALLLCLWQFLGSESSLSFPRPTTWLDAINRMYSDGTLVRALSHTLTVYAISLVIATVIGALLGMAIGASRRIDRALGPFLDFVRTLPPPVIVPVATVVLGITLQTSITIVVLAVTWPVVLNTATAMRAIPPVRIEMSRALGLRRRDRFFKIVLPSVAPGVAIGLRIVVSVALLVSLLVDIIGSGEGIGQILAVKQQTFDSAGVWGILLVIATLGYLLNLAIGFAEGCVFRNWPPGSRP